MRAEYGLFSCRITFPGLPTQWPSRAIAALLLCLHCADSKPVITFFKYLSTNEQLGSAIEILSDVISIASEFISSEPLVISLQINDGLELTLMIVYCRKILWFVTDRCSTLFAMLSTVVGLLMTEILLLKKYGMKSEKWLALYWKKLDWWVRRWICKLIVYKF